VSRPLSSNPNIPPSLPNSLLPLRVLESLKAGKRLPEARFSNLKVALKGQDSVYGTLSAPAVTADEKG
jgi:hypothetical protein